MNTWILISNVDDVLERYGQDAFDQFPGSAKVILVDYLDIVLGKDGEVRFYYRGEEMEAPDVFWPAIPNTDAFAIENMLISAGAKSLLDLSEVAVARSKLASYQRLASAGFRVPDTIAFFNHPDKQFIIERMGFPFVAKPDNGFGGVGVALIHDEGEFDEYLKDLKPGVTYMAQEYISTSRGRDVRVVVLDGEVVFETQRQAQNEKEFRSNVHMGGAYLPYELDEESKEMCKRAAAQFDLPLIGLDLMFGDGEFVIAEANAFPGLSTRVHLLEKALQLIVGRFMEHMGAEE